MSTNGPLITLAAAALVGAGLLTADALTDPARNRAEASAVAVTTAATTTSAASTTTTAATTTTAPTTTTTAPPSTTPAVAPAFQATAVYAGRDAATRTSVAVAVREGKVAAYVCDGKSLESWLTGTATGTTATLTGGSDRLVAEPAGTSLHVTGTARGKPIDITASLASAPAGLYRLSTSNGTTVGWIVQPDGTQVGLQARGDAVTPAPVLTPGQPVTVDGQQAYPKEVSGDDRF